MRKLFFSTPSFLLMHRSDAKNVKQVPYSSRTQREEAYDVDSFFSLRNVANELLILTHFKSIKYGYKHTFK